MTNKLYTLASSILFQKVAEETVILSSETGVYFTLDAVGTFIVEQLQAGFDIKNTALIVTENYHVELTTAEEDVNELVDTMVNKGILIVQ